MSSNEFYIKDQGVFQHLFMLLGKLVHIDLVRQVEYLKVENQILRSKLGRMVQVSPSEKRRLMKFGSILGPGLKDLISIVSYSTFKRWFNRSPQRKRIKKGRKKTAQEIRDLVVRLAKENNWGYTRILGELKKLGIYSISRNTVKNILKEYGLDPVPQRGEDSWDEFLKRHLETLWACDFFSKTIWTLLGAKTFHILFFIHVYTRKVYIAGMTTHPNAQWVDEATRSLSFLFQDDSEKILIRDSDCKFLGRFDDIFRGWNTQVRKIPFRSPNLNPYAEGWVGTIKRECLNHFFVFGEDHLKYLVEEFVKYYNRVRPHSSKGNLPLNMRSYTTTGNVQCKSKLGGLLKHYYRIG